MRAGALLAALVNEALAPSSRTWEQFAAVCRQATEARPSPRPNLLAWCVHMAEVTQGFMDDSVQWAWGVFTEVLCKMARGLVRPLVS